MFGACVVSGQGSLQCTIGMCNPIFYNSNLFGQRRRLIDIGEVCGCCNCDWKNLETKEFLSFLRMEESIALRFYFSSTQVWSWITLLMSSGIYIHVWLLLKWKVVVEFFFRKKKLILSTPKN